MRLHTSITVMGTPPSEGSVLSSRPPRSANTFLGTQPARPFLGNRNSACLRYGLPNDGGNLFHRGQECRYFPFEYVVLGIECIGLRRIHLLCRPIEVRDPVDALLAQRELVVAQ